MAKEQIQEIEVLNILKKIKIKKGKKKDKGLPQGVYYLTIIQYNCGNTNH